MNTHRGSPLIVAALAVGLLLAGCSTSTSGSANPAPAAQQPSDSTGDPSASGNDTAASPGDAPRVESPLDTTALLADACSALSASQLSTLGLGTAEPRSIETGPTCSWTYTDTPGNMVNVSPIEPNKNGLSDLYSEKDSKAYFEETQVEGYPAVYTDITNDRERGRCSLYVGVTDQLAVFILTQLDDGPDVSNPCPVADKIGAAMVQTLKEG